MEIVLSDSTFMEGVEMMRSAMKEHADKPDDTAGGRTDDFRNRVFHSGGFVPTWTQ